VSIDLEPVIRIRDPAAGHLLFEPLQHGVKVEAALFLPRGDRLATVAGDRRLRLWDVPVVPLPTPHWLPDLAEAVAAKRFDDKGRSIAVGPSRLVQLRQQLASDPTTDFYTRWAKWFFADRSTRPVSPFSSSTSPSK
jgi:hypothetical protein